MQVTFVLAVVLGGPAVAALSLGRRLPTWESRLLFAIRTGAVVWFLIGAAVYLYARRRATRE
ncbi:MAG: DUF5822 domain-containing protein [Halobacteriaceae archaeon]